MISLMSITLPNKILVKVLRSTHQAHSLLRLKISTLSRHKVRSPPLHQLLLALTAPEDLMRLTSGMKRCPVLQPSLYFRNQSKTKLLT